MELWQERPYLYLISSPEYADQVKKSIAVKEIADVLNLNVIANLSAGWIDFLMFVSCFFMDGFMLFKIILNFSSSNLKYW